jgi:hypothetical protein
MVSVALVVAALYKIGFRSGYVPGTYGVVSKFILVATSTYENALPVISGKKIIIYR